MFFGDQAKDECELYIGEPYLLANKDVLKFNNG